MRPRLRAARRPAAPGPRRAEQLAGVRGAQRDADRAGVRAIEPPGQTAAAAETALGVAFGRRDLLQRAFVHRSYLNEHPEYALGSNERLEFLGDAVLGFVVAEHLYHAFPELPEGGLTSYRAALVRARALAATAERLGLGRFLLLGRGEGASGGRARVSLLAATLEAVIGAIFLDQGLEAARRFSLRLLAPELERVLAADAMKDDKSRLQEIAQAEVGLTPSYQTVASLGPPHAREFTVEVRLGDHVLAAGRGRNKQEAEQSAAHRALEARAAHELELQPPPP